MFFYYGLKWSLDSCVLPRLTLQAVLSMLLSSTDWIPLLISSFSRFYGFWTSWNLAVHGDTVHPEVANFYNSWTACLWAHFSQANLLAYKFLFQIHTHQPFSCLYILDRWGLSVIQGPQSYPEWTINISCLPQKAQNKFIFTFPCLFFKNL